MSKRLATASFVLFAVLAVVVATALANWNVAAPAAQPHAAIRACDFTSDFIRPANGWLPVGCNDARPGFDVSNSSIVSEIYDLFPAKDAIVPLETPTFVAADQALWLDDRAPVLGLKLGEESRCYPLAILNWHCLIHDRLANQSVYIFWDPPSGLALARRTYVASRPMGLSGYGWLGVGLTYEKSNGALWDLFSGVPVSYPDKPAGFEPRVKEDYQWLPLERMTFRQWRRLHGNTLVLSRETGYAFDYTFDPYTAAALGADGAVENYWLSDTVLAPASLRDQAQTLPDKAFILGFIAGEEQWAVSLDELAAVTDALRLDTASGQVRVHAHPADDWYYAEDAQGRRLPQVRMFWYAWKTRFPDTKVYRNEQAIETDE